jgi:glycosyltransferase involved in cell wall biosynthesis
MIPIISVIVPVYKVEKYLCRCLDSVILQTFSDFECILVDDGSPDSCPELCDEYVKKDRRFKVIHKAQNEGLPMARKTGLKMAKGDFVFHLDSDDWIEKDALEMLYKRQQETNADVVIGSFAKYFKERYVPFVCKNYEIIDKQHMLKDFFIYPYKTVWGKLYRMSLFKGVEQPEHLVYGEDIIANVQIFCDIDCKKLAIMDKILYNYDASTNGISQGMICSEDKAANFIESFVFVRDFLISKGHLKSVIKQHFYYYLHAVVFKKIFFSMTKKNAKIEIKHAGFSYFFFHSMPRESFITC